MTASIPGSQNPFPSVRMIEAADPTDYPADDTGERRLVVGPDHLLYLVDDAGAATLVGGAVSEILDIPTAETDDTLVLAPDGAGGVEFRAEAGGGGAPTAHGARVTRASSDYSIGNNTATAVQFDAEVFDTDSFHDNTTNKTRLTIPSISGVTTGLWVVNASGYANAPTNVDCLFRLNGSGQIAFVRSFADPFSVGAYALSALAVLTAGDYLECLVRSTGGSASVIYDSGASPHFGVAFIGKVS